MLLGKTTVFIADGDPQLVSFVTYSLVLEGYTVLSASDGEQALELIELYAPDLVLLGLLIPKLDGFHVCKRMREFSAVPILLLIARGKEQEMVHALDLDADGYLSKPFSVDELLARMRALLRRTQLTARARL